MGMAFLDTFFPKKQQLNDSVFDRYPSVEIHLDGTNSDVCCINLTEVVKEQGRYRFERRRAVVQKDKLEKIVEQLINISVCDSSSIGRASGFQPEC